MISKDPVALVTGAATGIGLETALAFARAGYNVVVADRDVHRGEQAATRIRDLGRQALFVDADVSQLHDVENLHHRITSTFGRLDAACNNAGIEGDTAPTADCTLENFDHIIATNLRGCFMCVREQLRIMSHQQGGGAIVNMASVAGLVGFAGLPAYCASKGGIIQLTKTAALEYADKAIRVNAVCPGAIRTEMIERITQGDPDAEQQLAAMHAMNRMGEPKEIANAVVWLCSAQASFMTGVALPVDGGFVAR